jgi:hypothetical protein
LEIFNQKKLYSFLFLSFLFYAYSTKSFPLLHKVDLHYKIIPSCNNWHTSAVSGVIKHLEWLKTLLLLLHSSDVRLSWLQGWKSKSIGIKVRLERKFCFVHQGQALPLQLQENIVVSMVTTKRIVPEIQSALSFSWVHSEFEYCSFTSS